MIEAYLKENEKLLIETKPARYTFSLSDYYLIPVSLLLLIFSIVWMVTAIQGNTVVFIHLLGWIFLTASLYIALGRFFYKSYLKKRTRYILTNLRALFVIDGRKTKVYGLEWKVLSSVKIISWKKGRHYVIFGEVSPGEVYYGDSGLLLYKPPKGFVYYDPVAYDEILICIQERTQEYGTSASTNEFYH